MATNPFGGLGQAGSSSDFGGLPKPTYTPPKKKKRKTLTARQLALILAAREAQGHRSFGDKLKGVGKGALGGATWTLDKIMRPSWAVSAATDEAWNLRDEAKHGRLDAGDFADVGRAAKRGFTGKERMGMGEVLGKHNVLQGHKRLRGAAGFGLDVVTDPLMLLSVGADIPTGGGATAAYVAAKTAGKSVTPKVLKRAAEEAGQKALKGETDDVTEELLKAGGDKFVSRHALLLKNKAAKEQPIMGLTHEEAVAAKSEEALATSIAHKEALENDYRKIYLRYGTRKHHVKVPLAPALARPGQKISRAGIPVISQLSDRLGHAFIPDWKNPLVRAGQVARHHVATQNADMQRKMIGKIFNGVDSTMDPDHFLNALHHMEQPLKTAKGGRWKAVVPVKGGGYKLNERYIALLKKRGLIDHSQEDAIRRYFEATESMFKFDRAAGVQVENFGEHGKMYVPHIVLNNGDSAVPTVSQRNLLTEAGFQKNRKGGLSIKQIKELVEKGDLPKDIETNPFRLLAHRSRAGAERQADMALINTLKASIGVPERLVSEKAVAAAVKRQEAALAKHDAALRAAAHAESGYDDAINAAKEELGRVALEVDRAYAKSAATLRHGVKAPAIKKLEAAIKRASVPRKGAVSAEHKVAIAEAKAAHDEAKSVLESLPEDYPRHNAKILGSLHEYDHLDGALNDFEDIKRADYERGEDGTADFQADKESAWEDVRGAQEDHLADVEADATDTIKDINDQYKGAVPVDKAKVADLESQLRKLKAGRVVTPASVKHQAKYVALKKKLDEALTAMDNPRTKVHQEKVAEPLLAHKTAKEALKDAKKELKGANARVKKAMRGKSNKAFNPRKLTADARATDKYGNVFGFPHEAAQSFLRLDRIVSGDPGAVDDFIRTFGKWQGAWKVMVTIVNPGYRIRNTMTDMWNMWLAGINPAMLGKYGTRSARTIAAAAKGHPAEFGWIQEAADHGILSGIFAGDIARVEKYFKYGGASSKALAKNHQYIALTTKVMQDFNKTAENWGRLTHYMWRRQELGESAGEAAMKVKMAHFDYEDLTPFEQKLRDTIFPFYTWTRKNIPYQVRMIFKEPGRYSAFPKLAQEATYASGQDPNTPVPEFVETGMGFPIGKGKFYMPQFGVSDLAPFQSAREPFDRAAAMLSPAIKTPIELYQNKSFFTGQPIADDRHPRAPVTGLGASLLGLLPGSNVGPTSRQGVTGPGANPYMAYLLGQTPITRLAGVSGPGSIQSKKSGNASLTSWLGGQSIVTSDPDQQAYYDSLAIQDQVDKMLQGLRDEGTIPTNKRKKGTVDKLIEQILRGNYGG